MIFLRTFCATFMFLLQGLSTSLQASDLTEATNSTSHLSNRPHRQIPIFNAATTHPACLVSTLTESNSDANTEDSESSDLSPVMVIHMPAQEPVHQRIKYTTYPESGRRCRPSSQLSVNQLREKFRSLTPKVEQERQIKVARLKQKLRSKAHRQSSSLGDVPTISPVVGPKKAPTSSHGPSASLNGESPLFKRTALIKRRHSFLSDELFSPTPIPVPLPIEQIPLRHITEETSSACASACASREVSPQGRAPRYYRGD